MTTDKVQTVKLDTWSAFEAFKPDWERLLAQNDVRNIFLTFEWLHSWWEAFGDRHRLYVLVVMADGQTIGMAPFMIKKISRLGRTRRIIQFIGTPNADYSDLIGRDKPLILTHIFAYLQNHRDDWDKIELSQIKDESQTLPAFQAVLKRVPGRHRIKIIETCVTYLFEGQESERARFELKRRRTLNKAYNDLNNAGGLRLEEIQDTNQILSLLPAFFHCHINRWMYTPTPSKFLQPEYRVFYEALARNLAPLGQISFMVLRHADRPIAYFFAYSHDRIAYLYTLVHENYHNRKSPGNILITLLVSHFIRRGYIAVDHTRGAKEHKGAFANREMHNFQIAVFRRATGYALSQAYEEIKKLSPMEKLSRIRGFMTWKNRIYSYYLAHGLKAFVLAVLRKLRRAIFSSKTMLVFEYQPCPLPDLTLPPDVTIDQLTEDDLETIASFLGFEPGSRKHESILQRFQRGGECFAIRYRGTLASISWGMFQRDYLPGFNRDFVLADQEVLMGDDSTSPVFRGRGLHPLSILYRLKRYTARGLKIKTLVMKDNSASLKGYEKHNFKRIAFFRSIRLFGIRMR